MAGDAAVNSDARLKQKVQPLENALALVSRLDGKTYEWKPGTGRKAGRPIFRKFAEDSGHHTDLSISTDGDEPDKKKG